MEEWIMSIPQPKKYIKDFEELGLGLFVHYGLYSLLESGEWTAKLNNIPEAEYKRNMSNFNPKGFKDIVMTAKAAGAKYICLTTRHHDGFSLYDTRGLNDFDALHSAAKRDLVKEFVDECRSEEIIPFFYHTTIEFWNNDLETDFNKYLKYLQKSVEILCTNYGDIGGLWFDGNWSRPNADWKEDELYRLIRKHQPNALIINNTGMYHLGEIGNEEIDAVTFERGKAFFINKDGAKKYLGSEICDSVNNHWGIAKDFNYKSPASLIKELCDSRKVGANLLLNVGPLADGTVPDYPKSALKVVGEWMKIFGEAIYKAKPYWHRDFTNNFVLKGEKALYFFYYDLSRRGAEAVSVYGGSEGKRFFEDITDEIKKIYWMDNNELLKFNQSECGTIIDFTGYDYGHDYCVRVAKAELR